jgi:predicted hotdog family 3-hydroxylacyl-ACP dehydratase
VTPGMPPIEELVPHRGTMLLLDRVVATDEMSIEAERTVPAQAWYLDEGGAMPAWVGIELMAQAIAAHASLRSRALGEPPKRGLLLGTKAFRAAVPRVAPGEHLRVVARVLFRDDGGFAAYDCAIRSQAGELASATLKVFEPPDFEAFIQQAGTA